MGLDMYLTKRTYVKNWEHQKPEERTTVTVIRNGEPMPSINPKKISEIVEEVGYWRKANAIHGWFVENVQNGRDECQTEYVPREKLQELLKEVEEVLAAPNDTADRLKPQSGFFFGSTERDEWYMRDMKETKKILTEALKADDGDFYYHASW